MLEDKGFWIVLTLFGALLPTGLYFVIESFGKKKALAGWILMAVGVLGLFALKLSKPDEIRQNLPSAITVLVILTLAVLVYDIYITRSLKGTKPPNSYKPRTDAETTTFNAMQNQFDNNFSWAQKVALWLVYRRPYTRADNLKTEMRGMGFERDLDDFVIKPLERLDREFVELMPDGSLRPNVSRAEIVTELLRRFREQQIL